MDPSLPADYRVPTVRWTFSPAVEVAKAPRRRLRVLVIGEMPPGGYPPYPDQAVPIRNVEEAEYFGRESLACWMARAFLRINPRSELWVAALHQPASVDWHRRRWRIEGSISTPAWLPVYVAGLRFEIRCEGDPATIAEQIASSINAPGYMPVWCETTGSDLYFQVKKGGQLGNEIDISYASLPGETIPGDITITETITDTGAGLATLDNLLADGSMNQRYDVIAHPTADSGHLAQLAEFLEPRNDPTIAAPALAITTAVGSTDDLIALPNNSRFQSIVGSEPFPGWTPVRAAEIAAQVSKRIEDHPTWPLGELGPLPGFIPARADRFSEAARETLLHNGISTVRYSRTGRAELERLITTYREDPAGWRDDTYLDATVMFAEAFLRDDYAARFGRHFANHKLADDGSPEYPATPTVTPAAALADATGWYASLVAEGLCADLPSFRRNSWARRSAADPNRLELGLGITILDRINHIEAAITFAR